MRAVPSWIYKLNEVFDWLCYNIKIIAMSLLSNQGPLKRQQRTDSQHSLYTDNSQHSDSPLHENHNHHIQKQASIANNLHAQPPAPNQDSNTKPEQ